MRRIVQGDSEPEIPSDPLENPIAQQHYWVQVLLLLLWIGVGTGLRFLQLTTKPVWTDEFATLVFSLGHSFRTVPLDQVISLDTLLQPVRVSPTSSAADVIRHLMTESTHPPLYFVLAHWWTTLLSAPQELVSLAVARSLPVLLGVLAIPAMFGLGLIAFRSWLVAHIAAALMAVSPFGVYLAQDARHYTLAVLWAIASLACFAIVLRTLQEGDRLTLTVTLTWIGVNTLGIATHYFFGLLLAAEGLVVLAFWLLAREMVPGKQWLPELPVKPSAGKMTWGRIYGAALGTLAGCLIWLPSWQSSYSSELTQWVYEENDSTLAWLEPIFYTLASGMTMLSLLPIQQIAQPIPIISVVVVVVFSIWVWLLVGHGIRLQFRLSQQWYLLGSLFGVLVVAIALFLLPDYLIGADLARAFRYAFVYFPLVILLVAVGLASLWSVRSRLIPGGKTGKWAIVLIWLVSCLGGITVSLGLGYQKPHRPDLVADLVQRVSQNSVLVAIAHYTHGQTGRLMGLAWEWRDTAPQPSFYLDHQTCDAATPQMCNLPTVQLQQTLVAGPRPFDLWLLNYRGITDLSTINCLYDTNLKNRRVDGYKAQHYFCGEKGDR